MQNRSYKTPHLVVTFSLLLVAAAGCSAEKKTVPTQDDSRYCLRLSLIHSTRAISDSEIVFRLYGGKEWSNQLEPGCLGLGFNRGFTYDTTLPRLCRGQMIHARQPARTPCALGVFRPYRGTEQAPE